MTAPTRIFLDTNVFIIGAALDLAPEAKLLRYVGYGEADPSTVEVECLTPQEFVDKYLT